MIKCNKLRAMKTRRHQRLRQKISGTAARPRLCVSFTANNVYVQFIDDETGKTLAATSTLSPEFKELNLKNNVAGAQALGKIAGDKAVKAGLTTVVFDRSGLQYHGKVKALADAARSAGLQF